MGVFGITDYILIESPPSESDEEFRSGVEALLAKVYPRRPDWLKFSAGRRFVRGSTHVREFVCIAGSVSLALMQRARRESGLPRVVIYRADDEGSKRAYEIYSGVESEFQPDELHPV